MFLVSLKKFSAKTVTNPVSYKDEIKVEKYRIFKNSSNRKCSLFRRNN
jgi:hypothetical protein